MSKEPIKYRVIPAKLNHMRQLAEMTQQSFANALSDIVFSADGKPQKISNVTVSQWEIGAKPVPRKYVDAICQLLGCTKEYLYGESSDPYSSEPDEEVKLPGVAIDPIEITNLYKYDKMPVFVMFNNFEHPNGWGLLNYEADRLIMTDFIIKLSSIDLRDITCYPMQPAFIPSLKTGGKKMDLINVLKSDYVYIIMNTQDRIIQERYNGLFHHNEDHTCLINAIGLTLPYEGLNRAYSAYSDIGSNIY